MRSARPRSRTTAGATQIVTRFHWSRRCGSRSPRMRAQRARGFVEGLLEDRHVELGFVAVVGRAPAHVGQHEEALVAGLVAGCARGSSRCRRARRSARARTCVSRRGRCARPPPGGRRAASSSRRRPSRDGTKVKWRSGPPGTTRSRVSAARRDAAARAAARTASASASASGFRRERREELEGVDRRPLVAVALARGGFAEELGGRRRAPPAGRPRRARRARRTARGGRGARRRASSEAWEARGVGA